MTAERQTQPKQAPERAQRAAVAEEQQAAPDPRAAGPGQSKALQAPPLAHTTAHALRQRAALRMQRSLGNAHFQRRIAAVAQHQPDPTPAQAEGVCPMCERAGKGICPKCGEAFAPIQRLVESQPSDQHVQPVLTSAAAPARQDIVEQRRMVESEQSPAAATCAPAHDHAAPVQRAAVQRSWLDDLSPRQALLGKMADFAANIPGYRLLTLVLGRDPISDRRVDRTAKTIFRAALGLVPGGNAIFQNLDESGAIDKAFAWLGGQLAQLGLSWDAIKGRFKRAWDALSRTDLLNPFGAWDKLEAIFLEPIGQIKGLVVSLGQKVLEFIFEGVMERLGGGPVLNLLKRGGDGFLAIVKDPIGFLSNLISGVKQGLQGFVGRIATHLKKGLMTWLFGELLQTGIELPKSLDLKGILSLVMQVLGMTWTAIRAQATRLMGERAVVRLERSFDLFRIIKDEGIGGLWEYIKEQLGNLKAMVLDGVKDMVITQVIQAGIQWLLGVLGGPAGAIVKAIKAIYDVVMWFVNNGSRIATLLNAIVDSIGAIASGAVGQAAQLIERSLANAIPLAIGFLAKLLGLGSLGQKIRGIIEKLQQPVQQAVGWVLGKAKGFASKVLGKVGGKAGEKESEKDKEKRLAKGLDAGVAAVNKYAGKPIGKAVLKPLLGGMKLRYGLSVLEPFEKGSIWAVRADIRRMAEKDSSAGTGGGNDDKWRRCVQLKDESKKLLDASRELIKVKEELSRDFNIELAQVESDWQAGESLVKDAHARQQVDILLQDFEKIKLDAQKIKEKIEFKVKDTVLPDIWRKVLPDKIYSTTDGRKVKFSVDQINLGKRFDTNGKHLKAIEKGNVPPKGNIGLVPSQEPGYAVKTKVLGTGGDTRFHAQIIDDVLYFPGHRTTH